MFAILLFLLLGFAGLSTISGIVLAVQNDSRRFGLGVTAASVAGGAVAAVLLYGYLSSRVG